MNNFEEIIKGPGYVAVKKANDVEVTFDPGAHLPQDVTVFLTFEEFEIIQSDSLKFGEIVTRAMREQNIKVR